MSGNKTKPTIIDVEDYLDTVSEQRKSESHILISLMSKISSHRAVMWGPSIIGFGSKHYKYESGREGDMPILGFSPRKSAITIYFSEGFEHHDLSLKKLGKYKVSVSCLYINKIEDIDINVLEKMLKDSLKISSNTDDKSLTVEDYIKSVPTIARPQFDKLRDLVRSTLPDANEIVSYGIIGYKKDDKRARVFVSGWKDHVAMYPVPKDESLKGDLSEFIKGKGTLWFKLDQELPKELIIRAVKSLVK